MAKPPPKTVVSKPPTLPKATTNKRYIQTNKKSTPTSVSADLTKRPVKNDPNSFADADYWDTLNALMRNSSNYKANMDLQKSRVGEDYGLTTANLAKQRGRDLGDIQNDFAARGVVKSGVYGTRVGQYETDYGSSLADLTRARDRSLQDVSMGYNNYLEQWRLQKDQAMKDAIQRKLSKLKK